MELANDVRDGGARHDTRHDTEQRLQRLLRKIAFTGREKQRERHENRQHQHANETDERGQGGVFLRIVFRKNISRQKDGRVEDIAQRGRDAAKLYHLDNLDVSDDRRHGDPCKKADLAHELVDKQQCAKVDEKYKNPENFVVHTDYQANLPFPQPPRICHSLNIACQQRIFNSAATHSQRYMVMLVIGQTHRLNHIELSKN